MESNTCALVDVNTRRPVCISVALKTCREEADTWRITWQLPTGVTVLVSQAALLTQTTLGVRHAVPPAAAGGGGEALGLRVVGEVSHREPPPAQAVPGCWRRTTPHLSRQLAWQMW